MTYWSGMERVSNVPSLGIRNLPKEIQPDCKGDRWASAANDHCFDEVKMKNARRPD